MRATTLVNAALGAASLAQSQATTAPGYDGYPVSIASTVPANETATLSFGRHYAVLNSISSTCSLRALRPPQRVQPGSVTPRDGLMPCTR